MSRNRIVARSVMLVALLAISACDRPTYRGDAEVEMRLAVTPAPAAVGPVTLTVSVTDLKWKPLNGVAVTIEVRRPDAAPESPLGDGDVLSVRGIGAGQYEVADVPLDTTGDWIFTLRAETGGGTWSELDVVVTVDNAG